MNARSYNEDTHHNQTIGGKSMNDLVTLSDAAKLTSKNPSTLRRLINEGKISSVKSKSGHHQVDRNELLAYYAMHAQRSITIDGNSDQGSLITQALRDQINLLKSIVDRSSKENELLREQNISLQNELLKITKEMQATLNKESGISSWIRTLTK